MRISHLLLGAVLFAASAGAADVYKWTGPDGRVHFGDRPPPDAAAEQKRMPSFRGPSNVGDAAVSEPGANVVMLSAVWCGVCRRARQFMTSKGIAFTEYDVETTDFGRSEFKRLSGRGVPIILVGSERMNGFSESQLESMLKKQPR